MELNLEGKVGIVTGSGSPYGIGRSIVLELAKAGAKTIYACDINLSNIDSLIDIVSHLGYQSKIIGHFLEVSDESQTVNILRAILREHGRFDFFFANAGYGIFR